MVLALGKVQKGLLAENISRMAQDQTVLHEYNAKSGLGSWPHRDGWGAALLQQIPRGQTEQKQQWQLHKSLLPFSEDPQSKDIMTTPASLLLVHLRKKSQGKVSLENTHPFLWENQVFCHNGTIEGKIPLNREQKMLGDTDSEHLFAAVRERLDPQHPEQIFHLLDILHIPWGSNMILSTPEKSFVWVYYWQPSRYFQMALGTKPGALIISSEPLQIPGYRWQKLTHKTCLIIDHQTLTWQIKKS